MRSSHVQIAGRSVRWLCQGPPLLVTLIRRGRPSSLVLFDRARRTLQRWIDRTGRMIRCWCSSSDVRLHRPYLASLGGNDPTPEFPNLLGVFIFDTRRNAVARVSCSEILPEFHLYTIGLVTFQTEQEKSLAYADSHCIYFEKNICSWGIKASRNEIKL